MKILFLGGSGLLGKYLIPFLKQHDGDDNLYPRLEIDAPTHKALDITQNTVAGDYDLIIHAAAYTDVVKAEKEREKCFEVNVLGVLNLLKTYPVTPFVYVSSEYAYNPVNFYSVTKFLAELVVKEMAGKYFIIRTLFKPNPFPWNKAFVDQWTQGDSVDIIAQQMAKEILYWNRNRSKVQYIGTGRKTIFSLAQKTRPDVGECSVKDITGVTLPTDYR